MPKKRDPEDLSHRYHLRDLASDSGEEEQQEFKRRKVHHSTLPQGPITQGFTPINRSRSEETARVQSRRDILSTPDAIESSLVYVSSYMKKLIIKQ